MQYKRKKVNESKEDFFIYKPKHTTKKIKIQNKTNKNNPFGKLSELRFR